ncbi:MAG: hydroxymethylbilane synthase [Anaerococcus vaginalis]|uniref:hydroxymethylbilane synthase n=1 Tax=Anaerococcus vaginalis TaxID=33037 RepID=UPI00290A98A0|nr:hydroxymethylbilane synthase [Anaerococcus vaginalis]MDU6181425.1 hydroxymethylbilane synthase [Anaerococcus vaginalis]MDU7432574.1 hydroxymethylbilane synthase [Anaerococcus vaginalis]
MIKIGSRGSLLALIQAELVKEILQEEGLDVKIIKISTKGDRIRDRKIDQINSKGVFVKEIEQALLEKKIDIAVHSLKDMPSNIDEKLIFAPALKAEDPRDVFVGKDIFKKMDDLNNALVGTGSNRRICQGRNYFLNIKFRPIRGNVETRIGKIEKENLDGVILAKAGLIRAGLDKKINFDLDPHIFVPSPCQGILGIEIRKEDENLFEIFKKHSHRNSQIRMESERAFQKELGADCSTPMGIFTEIDNEKITLTGAFAFSKNEKMIYERVSGKISDRIKLGKNLAKKLKRKSYKKIILAGAGIGPADNITIAVKKALDQADVIIYDRLLNQEILEPYKNKDLYYVGKSMGDHVLSQDEINKLMVDLAKSGKKVVRLKGGDPYVFGRGSEEALFIKENGLEFETLPGLTSGIVCLNTAGIPPTHRDISTSISFITGHRSKNKNEDFKKYAKLPGSLVFYMGLKNLPNIIKDLIDGGMKKDKKIAIISNGSSPKQKVYTSTIEKVLEEIDLEKIKRPAIIVISDTIGLREYLNYFENKNFGRKIALTRDYESGIKDKKKLEVMGFDVKIIPTIKIVEKNLDILEEKFKDFSYDYLVFTSKNAVKIFFDNLIENHDIRDIGKVKIVAIGEKTKKEIEKYNLKVDIVPRNFVGENLLDEMGKYVKKDDKIFFPHSNLSRKKIIDGLDNIGILDEVEIYDNIKEEKLDRDFDFDEIIFTSSSCVNNFVEIYGKEALNNKKIYSIGQITTKTIENHGLEVYKESKKQSMDFLMEKIGENHEDEKN